MSNGNLGLYVHVPFCDGKCPYCDFYSLRGTDELMDAYTEAVISCLRHWAGVLGGRGADTMYFGGGTPNLIGAGRLIKILSAARELFGLENAEITAEVNPGGDLYPFFREIKAAGVNRLSVGLQSANDGELLLLGRRHTAEQAFKAFADAKRAGFDNISADLMLAVQGQTEESLCRSAAACGRLGVRHVSAYLLQVEPHTVYGKNRAGLRLPDEDTAAALYICACVELEKLGFGQYEISNFAQKGFKSRHNLKYWHCEEYLGVGPSAHSFINGRRFHYPRGLRLFIEKGTAQDDGGGGGFDEFAMLALRLTEGLSDGGCLARFGRKIPPHVADAAKAYEKAGLTSCSAGGFRFTRKGFLVSNILTPAVLF
ncbi:MAG TPA: coproporphyrinogen III oxidase [Ruminococcaceae bacterium]|nr:coproporphyrinogen III oxidase [Oscillospiraceae bacterium]